MANKCPYCGKVLKSHKGNTKAFRELNSKERRSTIAATVRWLNEMRKIHKEMKQLGQ